MSRNAQENLVLLVIFIVYMAVCVWALNSYTATQEQDCRNLGGTPVVLYGDNRCLVPGYQVVGGR